MRNIHFIVNPIAGAGKNPINQKLLSSFFVAEDYNIEVKYTRYKNHATLLTQDSINENANTIVACGGDGTINEVASCLVNTSIRLGIVPSGSGNGLASNLKIPKDIEKAIKRIKQNESIQIDVGKVNDKYFFSNMGIGFDAEVISNYENMSSRGLSSYLKSVLKSLKSYRYNKYTYSIDGNKHDISPFLFFISNSNEMGNNITLTPKASMQDGLLDIVIVEKINKLKMMVFGLLVLLRKHFILREVVYIKHNNLLITRDNKSKFILQIDGEHFITNKSMLKINLLKKSLFVLA